MRYADFNIPSFRTVLYGKPLHRRTKVDHSEREKRTCNVKKF